MLQGFTTATGLELCLPALARQPYNSCRRTLGGLEGVVDMSGAVRVAARPVVGAADGSRRRRRRGATIWTDMRAEPHVGNCARPERRGVRNTNTMQRDTPMVLDARPHSRLLRQHGPCCPRTPRHLLRQSCRGSRRSNSRRSLDRHGSPFARKSAASPCSLSSPATNMGCPENISYTALSVTRSWNPPVRS